MSRPAKLTALELALLKTYANGPRTCSDGWMLPRVWGLVDKGLIEKANIDPTDPSHTYRLTSAGREFLA